MSAPLKNRSGSDTMLSREHLLYLVEFTSVDDMVDQEIKDALEARPDWKRESQPVQDIVKRAREFYGNVKPGNELWMFKCGGATSMRLGLVIIQDNVVQSAWIRAMS